MTNRTKGNVIKASAVAIDVVVPLIATLTQFPVWVGKSSEATVSGLVLFFAFLSCLPFIKQIKEYLRSPSITVVWCIALVLLVCLSNIISEMIVVCFAGLVSNAVGSGLYKVGNIVRDKPDPTEEAQKEETE